MGSQLTVYTESTYTQVNTVQDQLNLTNTGLGYPFPDSKPLTPLHAVINFTVPRMKKDEKNEKA